MIRIATTDDLEFLLEHDRLIARELIPRKVADSRVYVATAETGEIVGWLRWGLWYDLIPFLNMLYLLEPHRRKGIGRQLVELWEHDMRERGCDTVMTSTQADEEGQLFYRKLGYVDTGVLLLPGEPAEIILRKSI